MKRKLFTSLFASVALLSCGIFMAGCGDDDTLSRLEVQRMIDESNKNLEFTNWKVVPVEVRRDSWRWDEEASQYIAVADLPELTQFIYEKGAAFAYIYRGEEGVNETQALLPFINTYKVKDNEGNWITFTETISCDFKLGSPSSVAFFIKASDLAKDADAAQNYFFKVVLVW